MDLKEFYFCGTHDERGGADMGWFQNVFGRPETRSSYTDLRIQSALQNAEGVGYVGDVRHTAALETVCRLYQAVFSVAVVKAPPWLQRALSSTWRAATVRAMLRHGESVDIIESAPGGLVLIPASMWDIRGGPRADSWIYSNTLEGPSGTLVRSYAADDILHVRWATERGRPWIGVSPMQAASRTAELSGSLETRQAEESAASVGMIIPVARSDGDDPENENTDPLYQLRADVRNARGRTILPETQMGSGDPSQRPHSDWKSTRLGGEVPETMVDLRSKVGMSVALAAGVPLPLIEVLATGVGQREAWRRFTLTSCAAVANILSDEIETKLGTRPEFDLSPAYGSDLTGRATAVQKLVDAGVNIDEARRIAGLTT